MKKNSILFIFVLLCFACGMTAQDIQPLGANSILIHHKAKNYNYQERSWSTNASSLPFFDDFSYNGPFPSTAKWDNSYSVFVNRTYGKAPPTMGVATFDGLARNGYPYNIAAISGSVLSDSLISIPIRLDSIPGIQRIQPADSVYLSFYYQAKGRGDLPEPNDELRLYFFAAGDSISFSSPYVWNHGGYNVGLPVSDTNFHRVMIPIYRSQADTALFSNGFRFAFRNFSTQSGAIDHWHIDQVYLNKGRSMTDTLFPDLSFVYEAQTLLKNFMQMPFNQFSGASDMKPSFKTFLRNNTAGPVNITTYYTILDNTGAVALPEVTVGTNNINNYWNGGYEGSGLTNPALTYAYGAGPFADSTSFLFKFYIKQNAGGDTIARNDTTYFRQSFNNYFAYDDGTAEGGYGFPTAGAQTAVKYTLKVADTLRSIDVFFDPVFNVNLLQNSKIAMGVWADNGGMPGSTLLLDTLYSSYPYYSQNGYDVFQRYQLSTKVALAANTTFYVGVRQELNIRLAIGFDQNTDTHANDFYYDPPPNGNGWNTFTGSVKGSLMIRPVFGDSLRALGVASLSREKETLQIYPNPASDEIFVRSSTGIYQVLVSDMLGNILLEEKNAVQKVKVGALANGIYLVTAISTKGERSTQKLIIAR